MYPKGYEIRASIEIPTDGNAVPYTRMTQAEARIGSKRTKRYFAWKAHISMSTVHLAYQRAPQEKTYLYIHVYFRDRRHGDPDNIFKGIADTLYVQDKLVAGCVDFGYDKENPRVIVTILERSQ